MRIKYNAVIITMLLTMVCGDGIAQQSNTDSLKRAIKMLYENKHFKADTNLVKLQNSLAYTYVFNNPDTSFIYSRQALELSNKLNYKKGCCLSLRLIAVGYNMLGNYTLAYSHFQRALAVAESANDDDLIVSCLFNMINVYIIQNDLVQQERYLDKVVNIYNRNKKPSLLVQILSARAQMYDKQNKTDLALDNLFKVLQICRSDKGKNFGHFVNSSEHTIAFTSNDIGNIYARQGRYGKAISYFNDALAYYKQANDIVGLIDTYGFLAEMFYRIKDYDTALNYGLKSYNLSRRKKLFRPLKDITEILYPIYKANGEYKKALEFHELFKTYSDSIFNEAKIKEIGRLEAKYEFDRQQTRSQIVQHAKDAINERSSSRKSAFIGVTLLSLIISIGITGNIYKSRQRNVKANEELLRKNQEIEKQASTLELQAVQLNELNQVKNKLFSVIAHDLRTPLVSFIQMLNLVEDETVNGEEFRAIVPQLVQNVSYTSMLLENLLMWANSQMNGFAVNKEVFYLGEIVENNIRIFERQIFQKNIKVDNLVHENIEIGTDKNIVDLTLRNLIANAIKFTPVNGCITISAINAVNAIDVLVSDTGIGMTGEQTKKLFGSDMHSSIGTNNEKGTGLGLKICKEFIERVGGHISVSSQVGKGSVFRISIPV